MPVDPWRVNPKIDLGADVDYDLDETGNYIFGSKHVAIGVCTRGHISGDEALYTLCMALNKLFIYERDPFIRATIDTRPEKIPNSTSLMTSDTAKKFAQLDFLSMDYDGGMRKLSNFLTKARFNRKMSPILDQYKITVTIK